MSRTSTIIGSVLALSLITSVAARGAAVTGRRSDAPSTRIVVVGDSVAWGAYDQIRGGWVTRLAGLLAADYPRRRFTVIDAAGNGGTSANLPRALRNVQRDQPDLLIIAYGLNDFDEHIARTRMAQQVREAVQTLRRWPKPPATVIMGMPPITALSAQRLRLERGYTDELRRVALAEHAGYIDEFDLWLALGDDLMHSLRHDTEHPNSHGYAFMASVVAAVLEGAYLDASGRVDAPRTPPTCSLSLCAP